MMLNERFLKVLSDLGICTMEENSVKENDREYWFDIQTDKYIKEDCMEIIRNLFNPDRLEFFYYWDLNDKRNKLCLVIGFNDKKTKGVGK